MFKKFNKKNWKTECIVSGISKIPTWQAHFMLCIAMLGGVMFTVGIFILPNHFPPKFQEIFHSVPPQLGLILLGCFTFWAFFQFPYVIYLSKELQNTKNKLRELEEKIQNMEFNN